MQTQEKSVALQHQFSQNQIDLIKDTVCKGATNEELQIFLHVSKHLGLDPFLRQIYSISRWDSNLRRNTRQIQTSIDGYRLIADRTGKYMPGDEAKFTYDEDGHLLSATSYVKRLDPKGDWHQISATAFWSEYCATSKEGRPMALWASKPHIMLAKCSEALALRRAFPAELSGVYTDDEMHQAGPEIASVPKAKMTAGQIKEIFALCESDRARVDRILDHYEVEHLAEIDGSEFKAICQGVQAMLKQEKRIAAAAAASNGAEEV